MPYDIDVRAVYEDARIVPATEVQISTVVLGAGETTTLTFTAADLLPIFDAYVFMDANGTLQPQVKPTHNTAGVGSTWRNFIPSYAIVASAILPVSALRLIGAEGRWTLTATTATTVVEFLVLARSIG